jgi:hypothetical protein
LERRLGYTAEMPAGCHRADEDLRIEKVLGEADPVTEDGSVRVGARRIDGDDSDAVPGCADMADER